MKTSQSTTKPLRLWVNTGELSGDMQAAAVLTALTEYQPDVEILGMGGPYLEKAGQHAMARIESLSVMGIMEIFTAIPRALYLLSQIKQALQKEKPDAVLLVDAAEFNFRVARIAYDLGIPVYYFIPPKVWAWRIGRVQFLQHFIKRMLCILPFEKDFYDKHNIDVDYVGNPIVDLVDYESIKHITPLSRRIGIMPGSRRKEIEQLLPVFAQTATELVKDFPHLEFHCVRAPTIPKELITTLWQSPIPLRIHESENRYAFMRTCKCILAASGTATLETALAGVPTLVAYKVSPLSVFLFRHLIKVEFASLPNLIMQRAIFPEFLQENANPQALAKHVHTWLTQPEILENVQKDMDTVRQLCGEKGTAKRAAQSLMQALGLSSQSTS